MAYFVKCFFFALVSFAEHGDCIWSVGEIVGLLKGEGKRGLAHVLLLHSGITELPSSTSSSRREYAVA